jgi:hypothetical protein
LIPAALKKFTNNKNKKIKKIRKSNAPASNKAELTLKKGFICKCASILWIYNFERSSEIKAFRFA